MEQHAITLRQIHSDLVYGLEDSPPADRIRTHLRFLRGLDLTTIVGDYAFVHAGVRPGVPLDRPAG